MPDNDDNDDDDDDDDDYAGYSNNNNNMTSRNIVLEVAETYNTCLLHQWDWKQQTDTV